MASRRILPDTVILRNRIDEVDDAAIYQDSIIHFCYCPSLVANTLNIQGKVPSANADLYIFDRASLVVAGDNSRRAYLPCDEWEKTADKSPFWTLQEGDYIINGSRQFRISSYTHKVQGTRRMWHFEVVGK